MTLTQSLVAGAGTGSELKAALRRTQRRSQLKAGLLILPLLLFLLVNFVLPIGLMLYRGVHDPEVAAVFPKTATALTQWNGEALPPKEAAATFSAELAAARGTEAMSFVANRLNFDINGFRSLLLKTARRAPPPTSPDPMQALIDIDPLWGKAETWAAIKRAAGPYTDFYLLAALDLKESATGEINAVPREQAVFQDVFIRTFWISLVVTLCCLVLGFPVAYLLATLPAGLSNLLMLLVLLPFWTSLLVRTTAWVVLLQTDGVMNGLLQWTGLVSEPVRLIYNRVGVYIAITHVLLPFLILPLYSVMKGIPKTTMRAAVSLGAHPFVAFARVYLPQTLPGIAAGCLLVFISAIGYYITPALIGGADDQMISYFIAFYTNQTMNWGMAGALGVILLAATLVLYILYGRISGGAGPRWG